MKFRRISAWLLALVLAVLCAVPAGAASAPDRETTILFTHDLHSHFPRGIQGMMWRKRRSLP